eukprot:jgi/Bigna1/59540/fgenesh1_kg.5_\
MGGDPRYPYPKKVWTPAGGWWRAVPNPMGRAALAIGVIIGVSAPLCAIASSNTLKYNNNPDPAALGNAKYRRQLGEPPAMESE